MQFALGATSSIWDALQSLRAQSGTTSQATASAFEPIGDVATPESTTTACSSGNCSSPLSSQTLGALIAARNSSVAGPSNSLPAASQNTIGQSTPPTAVTNADGWTTTSFTLADGTKVTLETRGFQATKIALPSSLATSSYNLVEQAIQRDTQSLSANASAHLSVNV
jgi:hypothetical protein